MALLVTFPLALLGLLAAPLLAAIYLFHRQPKVLDVSSLMLWASLPRPRSGGRVVERPRFPLTFWLELAILVLLVLAAAGPLLPWRGERPLVVILDDSLSMQAGRGGDTARQRAYDFLQREIVGARFRPIHFVLAGPTPQLAQLEHWTCAATAADLDAALAFAAQVAERDALTLVMTDHAPDRKPGPRVRWMAFGRKDANVAFTAAGRWSRGGRDRLTLELANDSASDTTATLEIAANERVVQRQAVPIGPRARRSVALDLPAGTGRVEARIGDDGASFDNRVLLLPDARPPLRVSVDLANERLRDGVARALEATERAVVAPQGELLITDHAAPSVAAPASGAGGRERPPPHSWALQFDLRSGGVSHGGPFFVDRTHPLMDGVSLDGVIWTAPTAPLPGTPLVMAGRQALLSDEALPDGQHRLHAAIDPALSTLDRSPAWPALWWNLIEWRERFRPGVRPTNVTVGSNVDVVLAPGVTEVSVTAPDGSTRKVVPPAAGSMPLAATAPGLWTITAGGARTSFAANALVAPESDLSSLDSGEKSRWGEAELTSNGALNVAPLLLLAALVIAAAHQRVVHGAPAW